MLEVLRVIAQSTKYLRHNIIFLFNGAEENILQVFTKNVLCNILFIYLFICINI